MSLQPPRSPSRARLLLSVVGLACVVISLILAFRQPFGFWHWLLLLAALGCLFLSRRVDR